MARTAVPLPWWRWLKAAVADVHADLRSLALLAWPWYAAAAVVLAQAWLLFGLSPFGGREVGEFWLPAVIQEILLGLSGAAIAVRVTRHVALGEPLVVSLRTYAHLVARFAWRFVLAFVAAAAITAGATLIIGGIAGIKALVLPMGILLLLKQALVILLVVLVFAFVSGRLHVWLTAAALGRDDLDLKSSWALGGRAKLALTMGIAALYLPPLAIDLAILRLVPAGSGLALTLPAFLVETVVSLLFTAALAGYFARLVPALAPTAGVSAPDADLGMAVSGSRTG